MPFDPRNTDPGGMGGYWVQNTASEVPTQLVNRDAAPVAQGDWLTAPAAQSSGETFLGNTMQSAGGAAVANPLLIRQAGGQWLEDGSVDPEWMRLGFPSREAFLAVQERAMMQNSAPAAPAAADPSSTPLSNIAMRESLDQGNFANPIYIPEWQKKGFSSEEAFLATQARAMAPTQPPMAASVPPLNQDPRNTGGGWTTDGNSYYRSGDVYTGERRFPPYGAGFNPGDLQMGSGKFVPTADATSGYLSLENNRPRGMAQIVTPTGEMGRQPMPRPATPPRGPQPNDDPVSPSLPSPKPQPLPPGSVATPILDGAGNQVATKVTLPDGRTVWNIPNKNWDGSFGFPWTPPANFDLPAWLRDKTEGRPAPVQQDALRNRAQALPQQNMGQQIQQQVQQQMQQPVPAAPALPVAQGVPNAQALRESILQNVPGR